jgi:hypothetical protein
MKSSIPALSPDLRPLRDLYDRLHPVRKKAFPFRIRARLGIFSKPPLQALRVLPRTRLPL